MVVAPLSTITNWQREFKRWAPKVDVLLYHGSKEEREALRIKFGTLVFVCVCVCVCVYVWMCVWMDVWMYGCMDVWMYGCMDV